MVKKRNNYVCQNCAATYSKWTGKCDNCDKWNTIVEQLADKAAAQGGGQPLSTSVLKKVANDNANKRISTGIADIDAVIGGGIVKGGVYLVAGQPGIGKSTLLLQIAAGISVNQKVLYVSGEESLSQIRMRADRLEVLTSELSVASSTDGNDIAASVASGAYDLVIVDSIQTMSINEISSSPGSVSQITNTSNTITRAAKSSGVAVILVGHVTKEGNIAGPKVLEHLVDVVINFEGDRYGGFKMLRAIKNRYGATAEVAIMEMRQEGLVIASNPSEALLSERQASDGSVVLATIEGTRPLLVEVQALVTPTSFGYPKRAASGFDLNRLNLLIAMLTRRTKLNLSDKDVYINIVGGMRITDPAADLAICMALASASKEMMLKDDAVVFGEVGLSGEVRHVAHVDKRASEAKKLGFKYAIGPKSSEKFVKSVSTVKEALNTTLSKK